MSMRWRATAERLITIDSIAARVTHSVVETTAANAQDARWRRAISRCCAQETQTG
jgi:hypothetical protein